MIFDTEFVLVERQENHSLKQATALASNFDRDRSTSISVFRMAAISNDDLDTSITENWNCSKSRSQRSGSKVNQKSSLFSDPRRKSCITEFEADLGKFDFTRFLV